MVRWNRVLVSITVILAISLAIVSLALIEEEDNVKIVEEDIIYYTTSHEKRLWLSTSIFNDPHNVTFHFHHRNFERNEVPVFHLSFPGSGELVSRGNTSISYHFEKLTWVNGTFWADDGDEWTSPSHSFSLDLNNYGNIVPKALASPERISYIISQQPVRLNALDSFDIDGEIIGYYWEFGDGTHSDRDKGTNGFQSNGIEYHSYEKTGQYTAKLYVMDNNHLITEEPFEISIQITGGCLF